MVLRTNMQPTTPCLDCGTRYGAPNGLSAIPGRVRGLCITCYEFHRSRNTLARFDKLVRPVPFGPDLTVKLRHPGERRAEQRQRIAARVARHEAVQGEMPTPIIEADYDHLTVRENALRTTAVWLATHAQTAEWDNPAFSESEAAKAERHAA